VGDLALTCHAAKGGDPTTDNYTVQAMRVRKLTPRECERLQGFPDDYTLIPGASDTLGTTHSATRWPSPSCGGSASALTSLIAFSRSNPRSDRVHLD
jgi:hypothetical protein